MLKIVLWGLAGFLILIVVLAAAGLGYRAWRQHETAKALAITTPNGIDEAMYVRVGGIDQWISIRGQDRSNPVILNLHGGPGSAFPPGLVMRGWESAFTVVQWNQRGAGRTFSRNAKPPVGLTIDRMAQDGIEVAEFLRQRLHKRKIILVGGSWGTILGLTMVKARPDLFSVYVGGGNVTDPPRMDAFGRDAAIALARAKGDEKSVKALEALGPTPWPPAKINIQRRIVFAYSPPSDTRINLALMGRLLEEPGYSIGDILQYPLGVRASIGALVPQVTAWKAERLGRDFQVPMVFIQGTDDLLTPTPLVKAYVDGITAPQKALVLIPGAGHLALISHEDAVLKVMLATVRPLAVAADAEPAAPRTPRAPPRAR